ncbi:hypothetical protein BH11VER1_BH11VER1_36770 [soil metagenome]
MNKSIPCPEESGIKPFVNRRTFEAPRELVWQAWTDIGSLKQWMTPKGFSVTSCNLDLRPGGFLHYGMCAPEGQEMWGMSVYREILPEEKLVYINSFSNKDAELTRHPLSATWPLEMHTTVTFAEHEGKTTLTIQWVPVSPTEEERATFDNAHDGMRQGWKGSLDCLEEYLTKLQVDRQIMSARVFDVARDRVFEAWTDPEKFAKWWGPRGFTNTFHSFDQTPGGYWHFVMHGPEGTDYQNQCIFLEIVKPERIVFDHVSAPKFRVVATFQDEAGKTKLTFRQIFESAKVCEQLTPICVPANEENFDRLTELLTKD